MQIMAIGTVRRTLGILLVGVLLSASACQLPPGSKRPAKDKNDWNTVRAQVKMQLAAKQMTGGAFADAVRTLNEAVALNPRDPEAYARLAEAQLELGNVASAQEALVAARAQDVTSAALIYMQGVVDEQQERGDDARENFAAARKLDVKNVDYVVAEAESLVEQGRPRDALELLKKVRGKVDDEATVNLLAARVATLVGDDEQAVRHYRAVLSEKGRNYAVREEFALLLVKLKRCNEALPLLNEAIERNPDSFGPIYRALAQCVLDSGDPEGAVAVISRYLKGQPGDAAAQLLLAQGALATDDLLTAGAALEAAAKHGARADEVGLLRAVLDLKRGDYDRAESRLTTLSEGTENDPEVLCLLGELRIAQQRGDEARAYFERVLASDPQNTWAKRRVRDMG